MIGSDRRLRANHTWSSIFANCEQQILLAILIEIPADRFEMARHTRRPCMKFFL